MNAKASHPRQMKHGIMDGSAGCGVHREQAAAARRARRARGPSPALAANLQPSNPASAHLGVLGEGNVGAQVEVEAVVRLVRLQQLDDLLRSQLRGTGHTEREGRVSG